MEGNDDKFLKAFGLHLQDIREGKKIRNGASISLRVLEQLSNVDYSQIHRIEKGKTAPSITTMRKLANAFEISLADLVTFEE